MNFQTACLCQNSQNLFSQPIPHVPCFSLFSCEAWMKRLHPGSICLDGSPIHSFAEPILFAHMDSDIHSFLPPLRRVHNVPLKSKAVLSPPESMPACTVPIRKWIGSSFAPLSFARHILPVSYAHNPSSGCIHIHPLS